MGPSYALKFISLDSFFFRKVLGVGNSCHHACIKISKIKIEDVCDKHSQCPSPLCRKETIRAKYNVKSIPALSIHSRESAFTFQCILSTIVTHLLGINNRFTSRKKFSKLMAKMHNTPIAKKNDTLMARKYDY